LSLVGGAATLREGALGYAAMALGLALLAAFVLLQRRVAQPLLEVALLMRNVMLRSALLVQWLLYCNAFGAVFLLSLYMQSVLGHSANTSGEVLAVGTLLMAAIAPAAGILSDRYRPAVIAGCGVGVVLIAALISVNLGHDPVGADPARYVATMHASFWILAAITALALAISLLSRLEGP